MSKDYRQLMSVLDDGYGDEVSRKKNMRFEKESRRYQQKAQTKRDKLRKAKERKKYSAFVH